MYPTCVGMNRIREREALLMPIMYPTCVGMNRYVSLLEALTLNVPHMRGDEPASLLGGLALYSMYPTCVGMNRNLKRAC